MNDIVVIGDGAAALSTALLSARMGVRVTVMGAGERRNRSVEKVHGYLGCDGESPESFYAAAVNQVSRYPNVSIENATVSMVEGTQDGFTVWSPHGCLEARRIVFATGVEDRLPPIAGIDSIWGKGAYHCVYCHGWECRERTVAVLASGSSVPIGTAMRLSWIGCRVLLFTDSEEPLPAHTAEALQALGIATYPGRIVSVEDLGSSHLVRTEHDVHAVDAMFVAITTQPRSALAGALGCKLIADGHIRVDGAWRTDVVGAYAAGDVARRPDGSAPSQLIMAAASGQNAAMAVCDDLWDADTQRRINSAEQ